MCMKKFDAEKIFFHKQYAGGVSSKSYLLPSFISRDLAQMIYMYSEVGFNHVFIETDNIKKNSEVIFGAILNFCFVADILAEMCCPFCFMCW